MSLKGNIGTHFYRNRVLFVILLLCTPFVTLAQDDDPQKLLREAAEARKKGKLAESLRSYLQALPKLKNSPEETALTNLKVAELYQAWGVHSKSVPFLHRVEAYPKLAKTLRDSAYQMLSFAHYQEKRFDSASFYLQKKLAFEKSNQLNEKIPSTLQFLILVLKEAGQYQEAAVPGREHVALLREKGDSEALTVALNNLGYIYKFLNRPDSALKAFEGVFDIEQKLRVKPENRIVTLVNIGIIHENQKRLEKSLAFLEEAEKLAESSTGLSEQLSRVRNLTARVHLKAGNFLEAEKYGLLAVKTARKNGLVQELADAALTLSGVYRGNYDYKTALEYFEEHNELEDSIRRNKERVLAEEAEQAGTAENLEKEVRLLLVDKEIKALQVEKFQLQADKSKQEVDLLKKQAELEKSANEKSKLENERKYQSLLLRKQKLEAERRSGEISDLKKDQQLKELELREKEAREQERLKELELVSAKNKELEQDKKLRDLKLKEEAARKKYFILIISLGATLFLALLYGFFRNQKKNRLLNEQKEEIQITNEELKQKQAEILAQSANLQQANEEISTKNEFLEEQKRTIEEKNTKITDSINYASRIQEAMLPPLIEMDDYLPDFFVFFKPRDIVSGDFYWFTRFQEHSVIAAVDCTGHGVPGAFMSMLGAQILQTVVHEREILDPAEMLTAMHEEIRVALSQETSKNRDGMDASVIVMDDKKEKLFFAGARNPLVIVHEGEARVVKGDRLSVGGEAHDDNTSFTKHEIEIQKGDSYFIYSDGFQDQFGGEKGRKFMTKRYRQLLAEVAQLPVNEQKEALERAFNKWKSKLPQVDDVLIIGFKL